jgi:ribosomal protein S18 acetylase RimI-like enzyme
MVQPPEIIFRLAQPGDAPTAAALIHLSSGEFGTALFGLDDPALEERILSGLFTLRGSRFSYEWGEVAEQAGKVIGLLLAVPGDEILRLNLGLFRQALRLYGVKRGLRFVRRALPMASFKEVEHGELMVGNLAVMPEMQGRGIGRRMLTRAEDQARRMGLKHMTLTVDLHNPGARRLYISAGYTLDRTFLTPHLTGLLHTAGVERMVKEV